MDTGKQVVLGRKPDLCRRTTMLKFCRKCTRKVCGLFTNESGVTAIEYGLIAALIGVAIIGGAQAIGGQLSTTFTNVASTLSGAK
jgi:pilus assembly protein Flp/PilA